MGFRGGFLFGIIFGAIITVLLFFLMRGLITPEKVEPPEEVAGEPVILAKPKVDDPVKTERQEPAEKKDIDPPPPVKPTPPSIRNPGPGVLDRLDPPTPDFDPKEGVGTFSGEPVPVVRITPDYPRVPASRGQEGYVVVEFTIAKDGTVRDVRVVESSSSVFERSAIRAVQRWRYRPQIRDGQAYDRTGVRVRLDFELTDE